jgi:hypothetical protein
MSTDRITLSVVSNNASPIYPFPFVQTDALKLDPRFFSTFDAIHASPLTYFYSLCMR